MKLEVLTMYTLEWSGLLTQPNHGLALHHIVLPSVAT